MGRKKQKNLAPSNTEVSFCVQHEKLLHNVIFEREGGAGFSFRIGV
jgi:hypothetical protein